MLAAIAGALVFYDGLSADRGTDRCTAGPLFLAGGGARPGLHGEQPSAGITGADGDLTFTADFRPAYAAVIAGRCRIDPKDV